jgi:hypothetical protein
MRRFFGLSAIFMIMVLGACSASSSPTSPQGEVNQDSALSGLPASERRMIKEYPKPPVEGQAVIVHGDIDETATCSFKVFYAGEAIPWLGWGTYKFVPVSGTSVEIKQQISKIHTDLETQMGGPYSCPLWESGLKFKGTPPQPGSGKAVAISTINDNDACTLRVFREGDFIRYEEFLNLQYKWYPIWGDAKYIEERIKSIAAEILHWEKKVCQIVEA